MDSRTGAQEYPRFIEAIQESFEQAANQDNYKSGAFKLQITSTMPPIEAIDIFLASDQVTEREKEKSFRPLRDVLARLQMEDLNCMSSFDFLVLAMPTMVMLDVFKDDQRARGEFVPPMLVQVSDGRGGIASTTEVYDDGSSKTYPGGQEGWVPSAPPGWNERRAVANAQTEIFGEGKHSASTGGSAEMGGDKKARRETAKEAKKAEKKARKELKREMAVEEKEMAEGRELISMQKCKAADMASKAKDNGGIEDLSANHHGIPVEGDATDWTNIDVSKTKALERDIGDFGDVTKNNVRSDGFD